MSRTKPAQFKSIFSEGLHDLWINIPDIPGISDEVWHDFWVKIDEAKYLLEQEKSTCLKPALEAFKISNFIVTQELLANCYFNNKDYINAKRYLEDCLKVTITGAYALKYAQCLEFLKDKAAEEWFDVVIDETKKFANSNYLSHFMVLKVNFLINERRFSEALTLVCEAIEICPIKLAYVSIADIYVKGGEKLKGKY